MNTFYDREKQKRLRDPAGADHEHWSDGCRKGTEFCCTCHWGEENSLIMKLADLTWGYDVQADMMQFGPHHRPPDRFQYELWYKINEFSKHTPAQLNQILREWLDAKAESRRIKLGVSVYRSPKNVTLV